MNSASMLRWVISMVLYGFVVGQEHLLIERPIIIPEQTNVTLTPGTNFTLKCVSESPITWKPFAGFTGVYQINHEEMPESELRYESTIHLINITHYYVGLFWCVVNNTKTASYDMTYGVLGYVAQSDERSNFYGIYVFVNDTQNLLAPHSEYGVIESSGIVLAISCRATMEDIKLLLLEDGHEMENYGYDSFFGVSTYFSDISGIYGKTFTCWPESTNHSNDGTEQHHFFITYHAPKIRSATGLYGRQGKQLTLNCSIDILKGEKFTIEWTLPHENISFAENRVNVSSQTVTDHPTRPDLQIGYSQIIVEDVELGKDEGSYTCEVTDGLMERITDQIFIEILKKDDNSVDIYTLDGNYQMEILGGPAVWEVKYKGTPKPTLEWYDNTGGLISNDEYGKYGIEVTDDFITLTISDLTLEDSGNYTLKANNSLQSTEKRFELRVKDIPSVRLESDIDRSVKLGSSVEFICEASGYPLPKIKWTFIPCKATPTWPNCDTRLRKTMKEEYSHMTSTSVSSQTSVLNFNATEDGEVECIAISAYGKDSASSLIRVDDMDEPFQIWGVDLHTKIDAVDNVTAICGASRFLPSRADTEYSYREMITWTNIKTTHSGIYECKTLLRGQQAWESKRWNITVYEPMRPEIVDPTETFTMLEGEPIQLNCIFTGMPVSTIKWHKNGTLIEDDNGMSFVTNGQTLKYEGESKCIGKHRVGSAEKLITLNVHSNASNLLQKI